MPGFIRFPWLKKALTLTIIETHKDGETSISFDDGGFENDSIDKVNDDDLDMGWEGEDLNVMTAYTRFQNVTIPRGATINSAKMAIIRQIIRDEIHQKYLQVYNAMHSWNKGVISGFAG